jgi:hypothetical protein
MATRSRAASTAYLLVNAMVFLYVAGVVVTIVAFAYGLAGDGSVPIHAQLPEAQVRSLPSGIRVVGDPHVTLDVRHATTKQQLLFAGTEVAPVVLFGVGLLLLRRLAGSVRGGDPFNRANVQRLRSLGVLLLAGSLASALVDWLFRRALVDTLPPGAFGNISVEGFHAPFPVLIAGLGAFILAEVFAYGVALREDVEATI